MLGALDFLSRVLTVRVSLEANRQSKSLFSLS